MGTGNPCENAAIAFQEVCDNEVCPKCNRPRFPSDEQPTQFPLNGDEPLQPDNQLPLYPTQSPFLNPRQPINLRPINPSQPIGPQNPIQPFNPYQPIRPQNPIQPIGPVTPIGPQNPLQPIPPPIDPTQGVNFLLFGQGDPYSLVAQGSGALSAGLLALLGADAPLLAGPQAIVGIVVLVATAIAFSILEILKDFAGRPKLQDTADIARFANSPSPILAALGKAAAKGLALGIPLSESNKVIWTNIFGPGIQEAYSDLQALYPNYSLRQINVLMYILISEMGHPESHSPTFLIQMLRDEIKQNKLNIPLPPTSQARLQSPAKMRVTRRDYQTRH